MPYERAEIKGEKVGFSLYAIINEEFKNIQFKL